MGHIRVLCSSANGKYPGIDTVFTTPPSMEVEGSTAPALNKLVEFLAIITLVFSGIALALTLILVLCWALNSKYLRNYLRGLFTGQWHSNRTRPNDAVPTPSMVSIHEGDHEGESEGSEDDYTIMSEGDTWSLSQVSSHVPAEQGQVQALAHQ